MLYPQNGDRIVAVDSVASLHTMYRFSVRVRVGLVLCAVHTYHALRAALVKRFLRFY